MKLRTFLYDAFSDTPFGGNVAGVVIVPPGVGSLPLQRIAAELNAPTTGFAELLDEASYRVRFFSATSEMDMCGHVTIGVACALLDERLVHGETLLQHTKAGAVSLTVSQVGGKRTVRMQTRRPTFTDGAVDLDELLSLLGLPRAAPDGGIRPGFASTGLNHFFVAVRAEFLDRLKPDDAGLTAFSKKHGVDTIGVFSAVGGVGGPKCAVNLRDLCHGVGNPEEAASGTTNGALAAFLFRRGALTAHGGLAVLDATQGTEMGRPSRITTTLTVASGDVVGVQVGGAAVRVLSGELILSDTE